MTYFKTIFVLLFVTVLFFPSLTPAERLEDRKYLYSIQIPDSWKTRISTSPEEKVLTAIHPRSKAVFKLYSLYVSRAYQYSDLIGYFENKIEPATERLSLHSDVLNAQPGKSAQYKGLFSGELSRYHVFFTLREGIAYIVWTAVPEEDRYHLSRALKDIRRSFHVLKKPGIMEPVRITEIKTGDRLAGTFSLNREKRRFSPKTDQIYLIFTWAGNAVGAPFLIQWKEKGTYRLIGEIRLAPPNSEGGQGKSIMTPQNPKFGWKPGRYVVEIWRQGRLMAKHDFTVQ
jgi:hypothetical protein